MTPRRPSKAVSSLISAVLLIAVALSLSAVVSPWLFSLTTGVSNQTSSSVSQQITCRSTKYDFDTSYKTNGLDINLSTTPDRIDAKVVNTGSLNLYGFSIEVEIEVGSVPDIKQYAINSSFQKTESLPLKPGQAAILRANVTENLNGAIREVKILNGVCPSVFVRQRL